MLLCFSLNFEVAVFIYVHVTLATPWSHPLITSPLPILNLKGDPRSRDESNLVPSFNVPV